MNSSRRHSACIACRERKVRCNGAQPRCDRCMQNSSICTYGQSNRQNKADLADTLSQLKNALMQAETALTKQNGKVTRIDHTLATQARNSESIIPRPSPSADTPFDSFEYLPSNSQSSLQCETESSTPISLSCAPEATTCMDVDLDFLNPTDSSSSGWASMSCNGISPETEVIHTGQQHVEDVSPYTLQPAINLQMGDVSALGDAVHATQPKTFPTSILQDLNQSYFDMSPTASPMIDKARFLGKVAVLPSTPIMLALQSALWTSSAACCSTYSHLKGHFYQEARDHLEAAEIDETGCLNSLEGLQTCILLTLYECKQALYNRAWVSVGRVAWLTRNIELYKMDQNFSLSSSVETPAMPNPMDYAEQEERRRTFWEAYKLICFASIENAWNFSLIEEIGISVYFPESDIDGFGVQLAFKDIFDFPAQCVLSPSQGHIICASLCGRTLTHLHQSSRGLSAQYSKYNFWTEHHHINEALVHASTISLAHLTRTEYSANPAVMTLNLILQATVACLNHAIIRRAEEDSAVSASSRKGQETCLEAALKVADLMRGVREARLTKMDVFTPWAIYVALQVLVRWTKIDNDALSSQSLPAKSAISSNEYKARILDSSHSLLSILNAFRQSVPMAGFFQAQIHRELADGNSSHNLLIGLFSFSLKGPRSETHV